MYLWLELIDDVLAWSAVYHLFEGDASEMIVGNIYTIWDCFRVKRSKKTIKKTAKLSIRTPQLTITKRAVVKVRELVLKLEGLTCNTGTRVDR